MVVIRRPASPSCGSLLSRQPRSRRPGPAPNRCPWAWASLDDVPELQLAQRGQGGGDEPRLAAVAAQGDDQPVGPRLGLAQGREQRLGLLDRRGRAASTTRGGGDVAPGRRVGTGSRGGAAHGENLL